MPIQNCSINTKPGFKWGNTGKCYTYNPSNEASKTKARNKARHQGIAEIVNNFELTVVIPKEKLDDNNLI